ncbi:LysR family transcriptional regulator [Cognatishimia sp. SS12]|uniref:LysR family transcriptional regulator n=1 Tax=Cognatishimia sp. SS12 TaxID=2979465 RepID=UPI00232D9FB1|nr:LysR family transcriptional regulator [Cognatishimia sp. SS12]MDC0739580.1 LysR family transcriptional regulator [Cognatishimia sp. SS12]
MRLSDIDLRLLRVFKAVAETGGFVKAQAQLGISQPAISAHIANLEQRLNVRLCNRGRQGFSLTIAGKAVLDETEQLLNHLDSYAARLNEIGSRSTQLIRIGVVDCLVTDAANPVTQAIAAVHGAFAQLRIRIGVYDYLDSLTELRAGRLDIVVVGTTWAAKAPDDLETLHLYDEKSGLFCAPHHPCAQTTDADAQYELLKQSKISAHSFLNNPIDESLEIHLLDENAEVSQGNIESTTYLTLAGTHVGLIPLHYAKNWVDSGALCPVAHDRYEIVSEIHAVRLQSGTPNDVAVKFWEEMQSLRTLP